MYCPTSFWERENSSKRWRISSDSVRAVVPVRITAIDSRGSRQFLPRRCVLAASEGHREPTMTSERAEAYGRLMRTLRGMGPRGLLPHEEEQIREAADALLFCTGDESDDDAREALANAVRL